MKESTIICRIKATEKEMLSVEAEAKGLTLSQLVRKKLMDEGTAMAKPLNLTEALCNLMTEVRKLGEEHPDIDMESIEREAGKLWEF